MCTCQCFTLCFVATSPMRPLMVCRTVICASATRTFVDATHAIAHSTGVPCLFFLFALFSHTYLGEKRGGRYVQRGVYVPDTMKEKKGGGPKPRVSKDVVIRKMIVFDVYICHGNFMWILCCTLPFWHDYTVASSPQSIPIFTQTKLGKYMYDSAKILCVYKWLQQY